MPRNSTMFRIAGLAMAFSMGLVLAAIEAAEATECRYEDSSGNEQCTEKAKASFVCCRKYALCGRDMCRTRMAECTAMKKFDQKGSCKKASLDSGTIRMFPDPGPKPLPRALTSPAESLAKPDLTPVQKNQVQD